MSGLAFDQASGVCHCRLCPRVCVCVGFGSGKSKIMTIPNPDHHHTISCCFCMRKETRAGKFYRRRKSKIHLMGFMFSRWLCHLMGFMYSGW